MFRNFHNLRGLSTHSRNQNPRWRIVFIALLIVLVIGSTSQAPMAKAAPAGVSVYFSMRVQNPKTILRCGQTVTYNVIVEAAPSGLPTPGPGSFGIPKGISFVGVYVEADSTDKSVGDFVGAGRVRTTVVLDSELSVLTGAKFKFKAGKPGKTTLYFDGLVGTEHAAVQLDVKVLPCKYKVKTNSKFSAQGITIMSTMDGEMKADEQGNLTGSATVNWVGAPTASGNCSGTINIASSQADLTGNLDENSQLVAEVTYLPAALTHNFCCQGICATDTALVTPDAVTMSVPPSGGVSTKFHRIYEERNYYSFRGSVDIVVIPVDDEAVSFIPGNHEPSWDDFLSLFGALLALY